MKKITPDTKSDRIYDALREAIVTGVLLPREKLNTSALAAQFGVSEIPVREALKRLQEHRLVKIVPYTGCFVQEFTMEELENLWAIRAALESLAVQQIVERFDGALPGAIPDLMDRMDRAILEDDITGFRRLNKEFHLETYRLTKNERLVELIDNVWEEAERAVKIFRLRRNRPVDSMKEHRMFLDAIVRRDAAGASEILAAHRATNLAILRSMQSDG